jgi:acetyltransferase-like isoleucine patch superfamily enzyme
MKSNRYLKFEYTTQKICIANFAINFLPDTWIINKTARPFIAKLFGLRCFSLKTLLRKSVFYGNLKNIKLGKYVSINREVFIDAYESIEIGNGVGIGFRAVLFTSTHDIGNSASRVGKLRGEPIKINDGVWIGAGAIIGPGVEIGEASIVSSGAVVFRSMPDNSVIAGNPARVIKKIDL